MKKIFFPNFSNSCSLNIFEPKIWRRLGAFPSCFLLSNDTLTLIGPLFLQSPADTPAAAVTRRLNKQFFNIWSKLHFTEEEAEVKFENTVLSPNYHVISYFFCVLRRMRSEGSKTAFQFSPARYLRTFDVLFEVRWISLRTWMLENIAQFPYFWRYVPTILR